MNVKHSLSPAQIQYLKIGPKVGTSQHASKKLQESLSRFEMAGVEDGATLASIPKYSFGNFESTVNNFGVLLHRNFVGTTTLHQAQKFGNVAFVIDRQMQGEKDKPDEIRKASSKKTQSDTRVALKGIYEYKGNKLLVTLKSFSIESLQTNRIVQTLPILYLKLIVAHVNSYKLVKTIESFLKQEGNSMSILEIEKIQSKINSLQNTQQRYSEGPHLLEKSGQQYSINLPYLQVFHPESDYRSSTLVENKDILEMIDSDMDNVQSMAEKYVNFQQFENHLERNQESKSQDR